MKLLLVGVLLLASCATFPRRCEPVVCYDKGEVVWRERRLPPEPNKWTCYQRCGPKLYIKFGEMEPGETIEFE